MQYEQFSEVYDLLMDDVDYDAWASYLVQLFEKSDIFPKKVLDIACGTGNITIPLSRRGFKMCGLDISNNMLAIAENKTRLYKQNIKYINQSMIDLDIKDTYDVVICACDGINYVLQKEDLAKTFRGFYKVLNPGGMIIFDISSFYKIKYYLGNNTFFEEKNGICYSWENEFDEDKSIIYMFLNFFIPRNNLYQRIQEEHIMRAYKIKDITEELEKVGFHDIKIYDEFSLSKPSGKSMRYFFSARKPE